MFYNIILLFYLLLYISIFTLLFCSVCFSLIFFFLFFNNFYRFVLFPCFILQLEHDFGFVLRFCVFDSFDPNCLTSFLSSSFVWLFSCYLFYLVLFLLRVCVSVFLLLFLWFCFHHFSGILPVISFSLLYFHFFWILFYLFFYTAGY